MKERIHAARFFLRVYLFYMENLTYRGCKFYCPKSRTELIDFAMENNLALIAINSGKLRTQSTAIKKFISVNCGYPDGLGAVWASKLIGGQQTEKMPGCELWLDIVHRFCDKKRFYVVGASPAVNLVVVNRLRADFPAIEIVVARDGFFSDEAEEISVIQDMVSAEPDFVFVAMGSPKQEEFIFAANRQWPAVYLGLGGSFDVYAGKTSRAPGWLVKMGLEWCYRVVNDPTKLRRMILDSMFVFVLIFDFLLLKLNIKSSRIQK